MKAVVCDGTGGESVLRVADVDPPPLGRGEIRIGVAAAGVNRADLLQRDGVATETGRARAARALLDKSANERSGVISTALSFLDRVLPALPAQGQVGSLWEGGLRLSYRAELRAEGSSRAQQLTRANLAYYQAVTRAAAPLLEHRVEITPTPGGDRYRTEIAPLRRAISRAAWALRIAQGKLLSVARLLKALFTFDGGLDYIAWKLERHSGVPVEIPDKVRRYPLIFIWGLFWKLYRRGVFR